MVVDIVKMIADELVHLRPDLPVYRENQRGGFQEPSFFVNKITTQIKPNLFGIQARDNHYQVVYFPLATKPNTDMDAMEELLKNNFNRLNSFAYVRDLEFSHSDGALLMMFRVSYRAIPADEGVKQQTIDYQGGLKNG